MPHVVLLGDSIFDNGAYVGADPDVASQVREALPAEWETTLCAMDGAVVSDVVGQVANIPGSAGLLVVSAGGNDALRHSHLLGAPARSVAEALTLLGEAQAHFAAAYERLATRLASTDLPVALCTIYDTPASAAGQPLIRIALALFNDVITRAAFSNGFSLIDLRLTCDREEDYANPIEPSAIGGAKIAAAIARFATSDPTRGETPRALF